MGYGVEIDGNKFVITGGVSQVGSEITRHLLKAGASEVVLFDNYALGSPDSVKDLLEDPRVVLMRGDVLRVNELYDALEGAAGIFALAGFLTKPLTLNPTLGLAVNVQGMLNVFEACRYRCNPKVLFSSSVAVYGETKAELTDESDSWSWYGQQPGAALYGGSKIMGENLGRLYHDRYGVPSVSLRYASVYGERQHRRAVNSAYIVDTIDSVRRGERPIIPDDGSEVHDYVHISDIAAANLKAMEADVSREAMTVATGTSTSLNTLVDTILKVMGSDLKPEYRKADNSIRATVSSTLKFSNAKIVETLDWRPEITLEEGIRRVLAWLETQAA